MATYFLGTMVSLDFGKFLASVFSDFFHHFCSLDGQNRAFSHIFHPVLWPFSQPKKPYGNTSPMVPWQAAQAEVALHLSNAKAGASQEVLRQKAEVEAARLELKALHGQVR